MSDIQGGEIRYTAKELFAKIDAKLDLVVDTLASKADHDALVELTGRVAVLEAAEHQRRGFGAAQKTIVALLLAIAGLLVPVATHYLP